MSTTRGRGAPVGGADAPAGGADAPAAGAGAAAGSRIIARLGRHLGRLLVERQREADDEPAARPVLRPDPPTVRLDDPAAHRQAQADAAASRRPAAAVELLEDAALV